MIVLGTGIVKIEDLGLFLARKTLENLEQFVIIVAVDVSRQGRVFLKDNLPRRKVPGSE